MNKFTEEQIIKLIDFIKTNPGIYDKMDPDYKRVEWKEKCWREIASNLDADERDCKAAWRSLKDQFTKRLRDLKGKSQQESEDATKKYKNFQRLLFLKDAIEPRKKHFSNYSGFDEVEESLSQTEESDVLSTEPFATVAVPKISPVSECSGLSFEFCSPTDRSNGIKKRKIEPHPERAFDFETNAIKTYSSPEGIESYDACSRKSSSSTSDNEKIKETFLKFLDKLSEKIVPQELDNIDLFFKSMAMSAKNLELSPMETLTLMTGVTEVLHKIVVKRNQ